MKPQSRTFITQRTQSSGTDFTNEMERTQSVLNSVNEDMQNANIHHTEKLRQIENRKNNLVAKQVQLNNRRQEVAEYVRQQQRVQAGLIRQNKDKCQQVLEKIGEINEMIDATAGAAALAEYMHLKTKQYKIFQDLAADVYFDMTANQRPVTDAALQSGLVRELQYLSECEQFLKNMNEKLQREQDQTQLKMDATDNQSAQTALQTIQLQRDQDSLRVSLNQQIDVLQAELQKYQTLNQRQAQHKEQMVLLLHQATTNLSVIQSSLGSLMQRVSPFAEPRHSMLAERATYKELLGTDEKLKAQADIYFQRANGTVLREDCEKLVLGANLDQKLREVYKMSLFMQDFQSVMELVGK
ncbi:Conserved_hypothetical protein [Hexamita inflata]|uniref:Uncharacterized protein n=1 Tax=Hexamita inflata TaxID=28002 RepID=A0AA86P9N2_9EUKA|nr:Conserved hypothetical protein [Hexamita inflata]